MSKPRLLTYPLMYRNIYLHPPTTDAKCYQDISKTFMMEDFNTKYQRSIIVTLCQKNCICSAFSIKSVIFPMKRHLIEEYKYM